MHEIRWLTWEPYEYEDCMACKMLPICMGGCSYRAMFINQDRPDCAEWKYSLEHYVRARFKWEKEALSFGLSHLVGDGQPQLYPSPPHLTVPAKQLADYRQTFHEDILKDMEYCRGII